MDQKADPVLNYESAFRLISKQMKFVFNRKKNRTKEKYFSGNDVIKLIKVKIKQ